MVALVEQVELSLFSIYARKTFTSADQGGAQRMRCAKIFPYALPKRFAKSIRVLGIQLKNAVHVLASLSLIISHRIENL